MKGKFSIWEGFSLAISVFALLVSWRGCNIAERSYEATTRPYLSVKIIPQADGTYLGSPENRGNAVKLLFELKNVGTTPATNIQPPKGASLGPGNPTLLVGTDVISYSLAPQESAISGLSATFDRDKARTIASAEIAATVEYHGIDDTRTFKTVVKYKVSTDAADLIERRME